LIKGRKLKNICYSLISISLVSLAVMCISVRLPQCIDDEDIVVAAAALTMSKGSYTTMRNTSPTEKPVVAETKAPTETENTTVSSEFDSSYYNTFAKHVKSVKYPVYTKQYTSGGSKYQNFYVKNSTSYDLNIGKTLNSELGFKMEDNDDVQVLIYHTHTCESYLDKDVGYYYSDYYPRTEDDRYNVTRVGDAIVQQLKNAGIGAIHDKTVHDLSYNGSYSRSRETVMKNLKKYPKIKVTIDIHRDSIGSDTYKVKPTFDHKGKKGAQIMIMTGYDSDGYFNFPDWNYNLRFALKLQQQCESDYGGMTRPLNFGNFAYNMNVNTGSLLIEVGTDANTLEEAVYSGNLLGKALAKVLQNNK